MSAPMASPLMRPPVAGRTSLAPASPGLNTEPKPVGRRPRGLSVQNRKPSLNNLNTANNSSNSSGNSAGENHSSSTTSSSPPNIVTDPGTPVVEQPSSPSLSNHHHHSNSAGSLSVNHPEDYRRDPSSSSGQGRENNSSSSSGGGGGRKRSSSIVSVQEIQETYDEQLDQEALVNLNTDWVNFRGAWVVHLLLIVMGKVSIDMMPVDRTMSWTIALQLYLGITFLVFHWVTGTPFSANGGAFDRLTFWEQIDHGAQYTPARKFLTSVPIAFFLLTTHYARYDLHPTLFTLNFMSLLLLAVWPKLPAMHRLRFKFFTDDAATGTSATGTPVQGPSRAASPSSQLTESSLKNLHITRGSPYGLHVHTQHQPPIAEVSEPASPVVGHSSGSPWAPNKLRSRFLGRKST